MLAGCNLDCRTTERRTGRESQGPRPQETDTEVCKGSHFQVEKLRLGEERTPAPRQQAVPHINGRKRH